jgi:hypothetical protein
LPLGKSWTNDTANMMLYSPGCMKTDAAKAFMVAHMTAEYDYRADRVKWGMMRRAADIRSKVDMSFVDDDGRELGKYQK